MVTRLIHQLQVAIYFHNALLRGNRSTKKDAGALDAFSSPNLSPLAVTEINIHGTMHVHCLNYRAEILIADCAYAVKQSSNIDSG